MYFHCRIPAFENGSRLQMCYMIENHAAVFASCLGAYEGRVPVGKLPKEAVRLLRDLDYLEAVNSPVGDNSDVQHKNRTMLLGLAARFEKIFELPMPFAPGAKFVGGMVATMVNGVDTGGRIVQGVGGRGTHLRQAFESCLGEAAEFLSFYERENDPLIHHEREQNGEVRRWVEAASLVDHSISQLPAASVLRRLTEKQDSHLAAPSTGIGAGPSPEHAIVSGLLEVVERDAVALWWYGGRPAPRIDDGVLKDTGVFAFAEELRGNGGRQHWLLDLTTEFRIPVVGAFSSRADGKVVVAGFSAGLTFLDAAKSALLEMSQMELAQEISVSKLKRGRPDQLGPQDRKWIRQYQALCVENYPRLNGDNTGCRALATDHDLSILQCVNRLHEAGCHPYCVNLTRTDVGIPVVRIVIDGLQSKSPWPRSARLVETATRYKTDLNLTSNSVPPI